MNKREKEMRTVYEMIHLYYQMKDWIWPFSYKKKGMNRIIPKQSKYDYFSTTTAPSLMTLSIFRMFEIASKGFSFKQTKSAFLPTSSVP